MDSGSPFPFSTNRQLQLQAHRLRDPNYVGPALDYARRKIAKGGVNELNSKRLLALNLRKLGHHDSNVAPRSYILPADASQGEYEEFVKDFKTSQALAVLKFLVGLAQGTHTSNEKQAECALTPQSYNDYVEGLWGRDLPDIEWEVGPDPSEPVDVCCVNVAMDVVRRSISAVRAGSSHFAIDVTQDEWLILRKFYPHKHCMTSRDIDVCAREAEELLGMLPEDCQLSLLCANVWLMKPSTNASGNGRGILLFNQLPALPQSLLCYVAAVGRGGSSGRSDALDGCILQKLVERPHLLCRCTVMSLSSTERTSDEDVHNPSRMHESSLPKTCDDKCLPDEAACCDNVDKRGNSCSTSTCGDIAVDNQLNTLMAESLSGQAKQSLMAGRSVDKLNKSGLFKYNLRMWVLASFTVRPALFLYRSSYIDLAGVEFSASLDPASHITNLLRGDRERGRGVFQRHWSVSDYSEYLKLVYSGKDIYESCILPQVRKLVVLLFEALANEPCSLDENACAKLRRLGFDFLVDDTLKVWLIEVNVLRNGYGLSCPKGSGGDLKRTLSKQLVEEEAILKHAFKAGEPIPSSFEDLLMSNCCKQSPPA